uniref:Uncharacterized protein n=1 Tax=Anguilla anguilla TaxID=7936 RepID=A0A0E9SGV5_ANGAN
MYFGFSDNVGSRGHPSQSQVTSESVNAGNHDDVVTESTVCIISYP